LPIPDTSSAVISRVCLRDVAYERLRDWILDGTLTPGEALRDEALAEALGMSRTPVREAVQRLSEDGLVITSATRRSFVSPVTLTQAREIYPIVATLEALSLRLAMPQVTPDMLDAMRSANERLSTALEVCDADAATEADLALHAAFTERSGNSELISTLGTLKSKVRRIERAFWGSADRTPSVHDHSELIMALAERNQELGQHVLARNWERGLEWLHIEHV
jgi:DNA-binding GntR family transcriptional regulator